MNGLEKILATAALAVMPFFAGCSTVLRTSSPALQQKVEEKIKYSQKSFLENFNATLGSNFSREELNTYGGCLENLKSKVDWMQNPDIKLNFVKEKTLRKDNEALKILENYDRINNAFSKVQQYLNGCMPAVKQSLIAHGIPATFNPTIAPFSFSKEDIEEIEDLRANTLAYAYCDKESEICTIYLNPLDNFAKYAPKKEICDLIYHEVGGHALVLGTKRRQPFSYGKYDLPQDLLSTFLHLNLGIEDHNKKNSGEEGYVTWYANYPKFLQARFDKLMSLQKGIVDQPRDVVGEIATLTQKYKGNFRAALSKDNSSCMRKYFAYKEEVYQQAIDLAIEQKAILDQKDKLYFTPFEDVAETMVFLINGKYDVLDKDPGTRAKAHALLKHFKENYPLGSVNIPSLPFEQPDKYNLWP